MKNSNLIKRLMLYNIVFIACLLSVKSYSQQAGTLDSTFGNNGFVYCETNLVQGSPYSIMDPQENILTLTSSYTDSSFLLVRHLMNGSLDTTFGSNGQVVFNPGIDIYCGSLIIQKDNKILVGGSIQGDLFIARFLQTGSLDSSFGFQGQFISDLGQGESIDGLIMQEDSMILAAGSTGVVFLGGGNVDVVLMRLLPDGTLDSSFGIAGVVVTDLSSLGYDIDFGGPITVQPDHKIIVAAKNGTWFNNIGYAAILRFEQNGILDTSFGNNGIFIDTLSGTADSYDIAIQDNGNILVAGRDCDAFACLHTYLTLCQYTPDGNFDSAFATNGKFIASAGSASLYSLQIQSDHKIVAIGYWNDSLLLMRFTQQGGPDTTFGLQGMVLNKFDGFYCSGSKVYLIPNDKITVLGTATNQVDTIKVFLARYNNDISNGIQNETTINQIGVIIYPNPTINYLTIALANNFKKVDVTITDITGKIIYKSTDTAPDSNREQKIEVNTSDFAEGVYLVQIQTEKFISTKKVIVTK